MTTGLRLAVSVPEDGGREFVPVIDGVPLTELVAGFEAARGWEPAGGYAARWFDPQRPGDVVRELVPRRRRWVRPRPVSLLECDCGVPGCWPLRAVVSSDGGDVRWSAFQQPPRPDWDHTDFGPFVFDGAAYRSAVATAFGS